LYYGFAEPVIIAGPRNAHRRPLIPPLAILFSSLLARCVRADVPEHYSFPGSLAPIAFLSLPRFFFPSPPLPRPSRRDGPLYNHYRLSLTNSWFARAACFPPFNHRLFVRLHALHASRHPEFHYVLLRIDRWDRWVHATRRANFSLVARREIRGNLLPKRALLLDPLCEFSDTLDLYTHLVSDGRYTTSALAYNYLNS